MTHSQSLTAVRGLRRLAPCCALLAVSLTASSQEEASAPLPTYVAHTVQVPKHAEYVLPNGDIYIAGNDLVAPLLADKLVETSSDGKVADRAGALALAKGMKYSSAEYYDVKVTAFGNTAIATGGFRGKGTDAAGKPFDTNERWTDTWMKMPGGKWQCIATQGTPVKM